MSFYTYRELLTIRGYQVWWPLQGNYSVRLALCRNLRSSLLKLRKFRSRGHHHRHIHPNLLCSYSEESPQGGRRKIVSHGRKKDHLGCCLGLRSLRASCQCHHCSGLQSYQTISSWTQHLPYWSSSWVIDHWVYLKTSSSWKNHHWSGKLLIVDHPHLCRHEGYGAVRIVHSHCHWYHHAIANSPGSTQSEAILPHLPLASESV